MSNPLFDLGKAQAAEYAAQVKAAVERVVASRKASPEKMVAEIRTDENTTDDKIKAWQAREEKVMAALNKERDAINAYIRETLVKVDTDYDETADVATVKELNGKITAMRKFLEASGATADDLSDFPEVVGVRGKSAGASTGTGKRPRLSSVAYSLDNGKNYIDGAPGEDDKATFSTLAKAIKSATGQPVEVKALQQAIFEEAKTDDLSTVPGEDFSAALTVGSGDDAQTVFILVTTPAAE